MSSHCLLVLMVSDENLTVNPDNGDHVYTMSPFSLALFFFFFVPFFFKFYFIFKLYNIVLAPPNIEMNPPQVHLGPPS